MISDLARRVLQQLESIGVLDICVCPGARNAEWVQALADSDRFKVYWFFEERSASFFALGRIRLTGRPAAVVTTSGTAVGELLPATMEGWYSGLPLVLLTADRPRRFRGSGAPQAAEQKAILEPYVGASFDLADDEAFDLGALANSAPLHVNVCLEDPKGVTPAIASAHSFDSLEGFLKGVASPLVVVGQLQSAERAAVERFLVDLGAPTYPEPLSGLRERASLDRFQIRVGDRLLARAERCCYPLDGVLRIGGVPTHRFWRDLEDRGLGMPVHSVSALPFTGLARPSGLDIGKIGEILARTQIVRRTDHGPLLADDRRLHSDLLRILNDEPTSEPGLFHQLSRRIERGSTVFLGNSLPIREWDLAADWEDREFEYHASRGLNGIDGQVSTFLGLCGADAPNWAVLGDLTTLYDLAGPWVAAQLDPAIRATVVVINNRGGKIFDRMFSAPEFQNRHDLDFSSWAKFWGAGYRRAELPSAIEPAQRGITIVELVPDAEATARFWKRYDQCL